MRREPLLGFLALGVLLFAADAMLRPAETLEVSAELRAGLTEDLRRTLGRAPTEQELAGAEIAWQTEEALYREGLRLGLDRGDPIVRRRVVQKMQFVQEGLLPDVQPSEAELQAWLDGHPERYLTEQRLSFDAVWADPSRSEPGDVQVWLLALRAGADPATLGHSDPRGKHFASMGADEVRNSWGPKFADVLRDMPLDSWQPVTSPHGQHLVRLGARTQPRVPALHEVRAQVAADYEQSRTELGKREQLEALRSKWAP